MNRAIKLQAFAKCNLSLNITDYDGTSGKHVLDSVMMSVDIFDTVTVRERDDDKINVVFTNADIGGNNTAYAAAKAVQDVIGGCGWDITIEKGIPVGAGLGGSSADGAAVLRALDVLYKLPSLGVDMRALALGVGSDVPFMLTGGLARVRGTGDDLFFIENKLSVFAVGLMSGSVSTAAAYKKFDELYPERKLCPTDSDGLCGMLLDGDNGAIKLLGNALFEPAAQLLPQIRSDAQLLLGCGAVVNLTGSGGMVIGYFTDIGAFSACVAELRPLRPDLRVFAPVRTGILHEHIQ